MKTKFTSLILLIFCFSISAFSQNTDTDKENYWILEDFYDFEIADDWIDDVAKYETYPNNVEITTFCANVEKAEFCASQTSDKLFRIRGLARDGYLEFTVPNAAQVKIYVSGKSDKADRIACIYKNGELVETFEGLDRTICRTYTDNEGSPTEVTYKIAGGNMDSTDPITVYYIEVLKYGKENDQYKETHWIKEDFSQFETTSVWVEEKTTYKSYPNNVNITTTYANVEEAGDCVLANSVGNQMRIGGLLRNGSLEFTVPNADIVNIHVSGKSSIEDRTVRIYRNNTLVKTYENLDKNVCRIFSDRVFSQNEVTYKVTAGDENSESPVVVYYIEAVKYGKSGEKPGEEDSSYWINENFDSFPIETGYSSGYYESAPYNIKINSRFANIEWGEACTADSKNIRISGREGEEGSLEFTIPDFSLVTIGLTGKSTNKDRSILVYMNGNLVETFTNLDREVCTTYTIGGDTDKETTFKIVGGNNLGSPIAVSSIVVIKEGYVFIDSPKNNDFEFYPNPAVDVIHFRTVGDQPVDLIQVYDISGRLVLADTNIYQFNVSSLNKGIYILKATIGNQVITQKLLKK